MITEHFQCIVDRVDVMKRDLTVYVKLMVKAFLFFLTIISEQNTYIFIVQVLNKENIYHEPKWALHQLTYQACPFNSNFKPKHRMKSGSVSMIK